VAHNPLKIRYVPTRPDKQRAEHMPKQVPTKTQPQLLPDVLQILVSVSLCQGCSVLGGEYETPSWIFRLCDMAV
jgi:hypothetical protein